MSKVLTLSKCFCSFYDHVLFCKYRTYNFTIIDNLLAVNKVRYSLLLITFQQANSIKPVKLFTVKNYPINYYEMAHFWVTWQKYQQLINELNITKITWKQENFGEFDKARTVLVKTRQLISRKSLRLNFWTIKDLILF